MSVLQRILRSTVLSAVVAALLAMPASAYIGPGAGFAAAAASLVLLGTFVMAFGIVLIWPVQGGRPHLRARAGAREPKIKRLIVVGLDGFDPGLAKEFASQGFDAELRSAGGGGLFPSARDGIPVDLARGMVDAYATGVDASRHNIYDFLTRDPVQLPSGPLFDRHPRAAAHAEPRPRRGSRSASGPSIACSRRASRSGSCSARAASGPRSSAFRSPSRRRSSRTGHCSRGCACPTSRARRARSPSTRPGSARTSTSAGSSTRSASATAGVESKLTGPPGKDGHPMKCPFSGASSTTAKSAEDHLPRRDRAGSRSARASTRPGSRSLRQLHGHRALLRARHWDQEAAEIYVTPINIDPDAPGDADQHIRSSTPSISRR